MSTTETAEPPTTAKKQVPITYAYDDATGKITRESAHVATRTPTGALYYVGVGKKYAVGIAKFLKANNLAYEVMEVQEKPASTPRLDAAPETVTATLPAATGSSAPVFTDGFESLEPRVALALRKLRAQQGFPPYVETPPAPIPRKTTGAGDKTPAYVDWLLRYHPLKFVSTYGLYGIGTIEVFEVIVNKEEGTTQRVRKREGGHTISRRPTHLTKKADGQEAEDA